MRKADGTLSANTAWEFNDVPTGGNGFSNLFDFNSQGDMLLGTDTNGAYIRRKNGKHWTYLFKTTLLPEAYQAEISNAWNVNFAAWSRANPNRLYAAFNGQMWRVDLDPTKDLEATGAVTLTRCNLSTKNYDSGGGSQRLYSDGVSTHPTLENTAIWATTNQGVFYTTDGGTTVTQVTGLPSQFGVVNGFANAFNTDAGNERLIVKIDQNNPNYVYIGVQGRGIYRSTTGVSGTFSLIAGSPKSCSSMDITAAGDLWLTAGPMVTLTTNTALLTDTTGWTAGGSATISRDFAGSMKVLNGAATNGYAYQAISLQPGYYHVEARLFAGDSNTVGGIIKIGTSANASDILSVTGAIDDLVRSGFAISSTTTVYMTLSVNSAVSGKFARFSVPGISPAGVYKITRTGTVTSYGNPYVTTGGSAGIEMVKVRVDPFNASNIHAYAGQFGVRSTDGGSTWASFTTYIGTSNEIARDVFPTPYAGGQIGDFAFDPTTQNVVGWAEGFASYLSTNSNSLTPTLRNISAGTEQKIDSQFVVNPSGFAMLAGMDLPVTPVTSLTEYTNLPNFGAGDGLGNGEGTDWAIDDPSYWVQSVDGGGNDAGAGPIWCVAWSAQNGAPGTWGKFTNLPRTPNTGGSTGNGRAGSIAMGNKNNIVVAPGNRAYASYTKDGGTTWNPVLLNGSKDYYCTDGFFRKRITLAADKQTPGTFAMVVSFNVLDGSSPTFNTADPAGLWVTTDGGDNWTRKQAGVIGFNGLGLKQVTDLGWDGSQYWRAHIMYVPGFAGEILYTPHDLLAGPSYLHYSTNNGATFSRMSARVSNVFHFGFGKALPGQTRPAVYMVAHVDGVSGVWVTFDWFNTFTLITKNARGYFSYPTGLSGDMANFGRVYLPIEGKGSVWGAVKDLATAT